MRKRIIAVLMTATLFCSSLTVQAKGFEPTNENGFIRIRTTAYTAPEGKSTATGHPVRYGVCGVNKRWLCSYGGTEWCAAIYSEDGTEFFGYFDCFDTGADSENQTLIDIYHPDLDGCQEWMEKTGGYVLVKFIKAEG